MLFHGTPSDSAPNAKKMELGLCFAPSPLIDVPTDQTLPFSGTRNRGFRLIQDPQVFELFPEMEEFSCSSTEADNLSVSSSDLSAESVADADEVKSHKNVGDINGLQVPISNDEQDFRRPSSERSITTSDTHWKPGFDDSSYCIQFQEGRSTNTTTGSSANGWTDDKHSSYLNFMEATFVKNMYERRYSALNLCGKLPQGSDFLKQDCHDSRPIVPPTSAMEFRTWQRGGRRPVAFTGPFISRFSASGSPAGYIPPRVKHYSLTVHPKAQDERQSCLERSPFKPEPFELNNNLRIDQDQGSQETVGKQDIFQNYLYNFANSFLSSTPKFPSSMRNTSPSNGCTSKHWTNKQDLDRMNVELGKRPIQHNCQCCLQNYEKTINRDLYLNTDLQLCSAKLGVPEKMEERMIKKIDTQLNKNYSGILQNSKRSRQDRPQPTGINHTSITETSRKRKLQGGLSGRTPMPINNYIVCDPVLPHVYNYQ